MAENTEQKIRLIYLKLGQKKIFCNIRDTFVVW